MDKGGCFSKMRSIGRDFKKLSKSQFSAALHVLHTAMMCYSLIPLRGLILNKDVI